MQRKGETMPLNKLRVEIDSLDDQLLGLLNRRMEIVKKVGEFKNRSGGAIYRPEREKEIISRLCKNSEGLMNQEAIEAIFLEIFAVSRNLELPEKVAHLGPRGSFTEQAAESRFGSMSEYIALGSIPSVFKEVATKRAKFGVVPIENSSSGIVGDTLSSFIQYDLKIVAEVALDIHHSFVSTVQKLEDLKIIYSKDIAFEQCKTFLDDHNLYDRCELIPVESTAKAAILSKNNKNTAAICSHIAAKMYNIPVMFKNIEDIGNNRTRFLIISDFENGQSGNDKSTILVNLPNKPGALVKFLNDFEKANINLTKIKSHIQKGVSMFFIDFNAHQKDKNVQKILKKYKNEIKFLGSYVKEIDDV